MEKLSRIYETLKQTGNRTTRFVCDNFDLDKAMIYWQRIGENLEPLFKVTELNYLTYRRLVLYINGMPDFDGDLTKSIGLHGSPGTGKTLAMQIMRAWVELDEVKFMKNGVVFSFQFDIVSSREIVSQFNENGYDGLNKYTMRNVLCIDDLGSEPSASSHYGNKLNVMEHLLEQRYFYGKITHYTTNLMKDDLREMYGERVMSRLIGSTNMFGLSIPDWRGV